MEYFQKVIVVGGNHHNTLGVIRSLGREGVYPFVILTNGNTNSFVLKSKYIQKWWTVNGSNEALNLILNEFASEKEKCVLIACHDVISSVFDLNRAELLPHFYVPGSKEQGRLTTLMNKKKMSELADQMGFLVPKTMVCNATTISQLDNNFFPCITKPIDSKSGSKNEIVNCNSKDDLIAFFANHNKSYIVQHFIEKKFEFQLIGCSLAEGKEIIIPGVSVILRQTKSSNTGFLHYTNLDDTYNHTISATKAFIKEIGYSGLFSVEFLRDKNDNDFFMEMNYRNDGNTISVANAGVNLPYIWYLYCVGADYKREIKPIHEEFVMPEFTELTLYKQGLITRCTWKKDMKMATSYMDYADDDLAPTDGWNEYNRQSRFALIKHWKHKLFDK